MTSTAALAVQIYTAHKLGLKPDEKQAGAMQWMHERPVLTGALLGGGIGALSGLGKDENGKRKVLRNGLIGALGGGLGGFAYRNLSPLFAGQEAPPQKPVFSLDDMKDKTPAEQLLMVQNKSPKPSRPAPTQMGPNPLDFPKEEGSAPKGLMTDEMTRLKGKSPASGRSSLMTPKSGWGAYGEKEQEDWANREQIWKGRQLAESQAQLDEFLKNQKDLTPEQIERLRALKLQAQESGHARQTWGQITQGNRELDAEAEAFEAAKEQQRIAEQRQAEQQRIAEQREAADKFLSGFNQ